MSNRLSRPTSSPPVFSMCLLVWKQDFIHEAFVRIFESPSIVTTTSAITIADKTCCFSCLTDSICAEKIADSKLVVSEPGFIDAAGIRVNTVPRLQRRFVEINARTVCMCRTLITGLCPVCQTRPSSCCSV
jgi:hypothetical protein